MRLGVSSSLGKENAKDWAKAMYDLGCKSVVFPLNADASKEEIAEYVKEAKNNDLQIAEVGIWRNALSPHEAERKANLEYSIRQLALADEIGARCCVNVAGSTGARWDGGYKENFSKEHKKKTIKMIQTIIDEVQPKNTYFTIEPMPWMIPTGPKEYLNLIEEVGRDRFAVHMDIINMICKPKRFFYPEDFLEKTFDMLGDKIKSCHIKDIRLLEGFTFQLQECACGEGVFPLERYAELANKCDKDMPMIIEHLHSDLDYVKSVGYVKNRLSKWL